MNFGLSYKYEVPLDFTAVITTKRKLIKKLIFHTTVTIIITETEQIIDFLE